MQKIQEIARSKQRIYPSKPEWKIILEHLIYQDTIKLYRICRKMIITLDRLKIPEVSTLMETLNPSRTYKMQSEAEPNWPKPKGIPFDAVSIVDEVFDIADKHMPDEHITELIKQWLYQENLNSITMILERQSINLNEVIEAAKTLYKITYEHQSLNSNERIWLRVNLIQRLLSENLNYINIAKNFISLDLIIRLINRITGPLNGQGKLGGKSAGLILAYEILEERKKELPLLNNVKTPKSWFITSDGLYEFIHYNALEEFVFSKYLTIEEIQHEYLFLEYIFKNSHFPQDFQNSLSMILDDMPDKPLVIRSSSLLEDSFEASFSGKYKSLFIANIGSKEERLSALMNAVAEVYASTFSPDPIEYRKERGLLDFREEMGILIQEVVGVKIGKYYFPSFAGVAFSINEFCWSPRIRNEDGLMRIVAGLGTRAVDRTINEYPTLVAPGQPNIKVNVSIEDKIRYSQRYVDVINLETNNFETVTLNQLIKETNGVFPFIDKITSFNRSGTIVDPISSFSDFTNEDLLITFNNLIERSNFISQIKAILNILQEALDRPVDIEFAFDGMNLYLLQCRPQGRFEKESVINIPEVKDKDVVFTANQFVGNGRIENIEYVVYVDYAGYSACSSIEEMYSIGRIIGKINRMLPKKSFILIGPGRWGSKGDIKLGVPVNYSDINNTAMLIEVAKEKEGYVPELSFGTHFFQDLVEANIKYLPLYPDKPENIFNDSFFYDTPNYLKSLVEDAENFEHVIKVIKMDYFRIGASLSILMDRRSCRGLAYIKDNKKSLN